MKILVGIPYHDVKRYCLNELMDCINKMEKPNVEIVMRFHTGTFAEHNAVKNQREFFRLLALEKGTTHFYSFGCDTIPPLDVLPRLLAHEKDVVGALYYGRQHGEAGLPATAVAWGIGNTKQNLETKTELLKVDGMGMDAVLFSRKAFESTSFLEWEQKDDDYPYYDRLRQKGFDIYLDPTLVCKHYYEDGKFI